MVAVHIKNVVDGSFVHIKRKLNSTNTRTLRKMMTIIRCSSEITQLSLILCHLGSMEGLSGAIFSVSSNVLITMFHSFLWSASSRVLFAKSLSLSTKVKRFGILQKHVSVEALRSQAGLIFSDGKYNARFTPLTEIKSPQHSTRHGYLMLNVIHRYYQKDESIARDIFGDGTERD